MVIDDCIRVTKILTAGVSAIFDKIIRSSHVHVGILRSRTCFLEFLLRQDRELLLVDTAFGDDDGVFGDLLNGVLDFFIGGRVDDH